MRQLRLVELAGLTLFFLLVPQLYTELRGENERLREALTETTLQLAQLKVELERATQVRVVRPCRWPLVSLFGT